MQTTIITLEKVLKLSRVFMIALPTGEPLQGLEESITGAAELYFYLGMSRIKRGAARAWTPTTWMVWI